MSGGEYQVPPKTHHWLLHNHLILRGHPPILEPRLTLAARLNLPLNPALLSPCLWLLKLVSLAFCLHPAAARWGRRPL